jgi:hypothetical protein
MILEQAITGLMQAQLQMLDSGIQFSCVRFLSVYTSVCLVEL